MVLAGVTLGFPTLLGGGVAQQLGEIIFISSWHGDAFPKVLKSNAFMKVNVLLWSLILNKAIALRCMDNGGMRKSPHNKIAAFGKERQIYFKF